MNYLLITLAASLAVSTCAFTCGAVAGLRHVRYGSIKTGSSLTMALQPLDIMPKHLKLCVGIDTNGVPEARTTEELFGGKRCIIFGVPGAFLGELSEQYLTSFMTKHDDLKGAGVEVIACVAVNDAHVMSKWAAANHVQDTEILMLADGDSSFTKALGYLSDQGEFLGQRSQAFAVVLDQSMSCEFSDIRLSGYPAQEIMGYLTFVVGTFLEELEEDPSKAAALASTARMNGPKMQQMMAAAYEKARLETQEISRIKNDFVDRIEMAGRQATMRLKTIGEVGIAAFQSQSTPSTSTPANSESGDQTASDTLPHKDTDEVDLRSTPMNLAKRNALEANRKQWGIGYDPEKPAPITPRLQRAVLQQQPQQTLN